MLTIYLFINGEQFAELPRGPEASALRRLHIDWGMIALVLIALRLVWRARQGSPAPSAQAKALNLLAAAVKWGLIAALVVTCVTGMVTIWSNGQPITVFDSVVLPSPMARNGAVHGLMERAHSVASHLILPLLALHVAGALKHALLRDGIFWRMIRPARP